MESITSRSFGTLIGKWIPQEEGLSYFEKTSAGDLKDVYPQYTIYEFKSDVSHETKVLHVDKLFEQRLSQLYVEFAEEDIELAESGLEDYVKFLEDEDTR